jgi:hypothetical protein
LTIKDGFCDVSKLSGTVDAARASISNDCQQSHSHLDRLVRFEYLHGEALRQKTQISHPSQSSNMTIKPSEMIQI